MKHLLISLIIFAATSGMALADAVYTMRVDGLACPYCAYGIEKKLKKITGIKTVKVDLDKGLVTAIADDKVVLTDKQMTQLFKDSGFTFRSMTKAAK